MPRYFTRISHTIISAPPCFSESMPKEPRTPLCKRLSWHFIFFVCTTFAWFTSKDEVTNRLSANADYDVSIVESFAPPENWLPGQEVNKDVYAVNTGNVAAFVEETVSGTLTITTEVAKDAISANSVKLTAAERYAVEAGSYLAYKPDTSNKELGVQVVSMIPDATNLEGYTTADEATDFTPDAAGLYVFRRSIGVDADTKVETFKYEAYYFDGHDYYKVTDLSVTPDGTSYAGDNVTTDGNLTGATAKFVEEETKTINPTALTYDSDNNRLVASYDTGAEITNAKLQELAKAYDNALVLYNDAVAEYTAALRENTGADAAVVNANKTLQEKLDALRDAQNTLATAEKNLAQATAAKNAAQAAKDAADQRATEAAAALTAAEAAVTAAQTAKDAADDAVTAAQTAKDTADADVTAAQGNLDAANADSKAAYYAYLKTQIPAIAGYTDAQIETWLKDTATYDQINGLNIVNEGDVNYNYHQLAVALKTAQREAADKAATLAAAQATQAQKAQALADANAAKDAAQAAKDAADQRATEAAAALTAAEAAVTAAQTAKDAADDAVTAAQTAKDTADADVTAAQGNLDAANADSKAAYYAYLKTQIPAIAGYTDAQIETWLKDTATYDQINGLNIVNEGDVNYNYHQLAVALKTAQREAADKAATLAAAQATQAQKAQALADATAAKNAAQAAKDAADRRATEAADALAAADADVTAAQTEKGAAEVAVTAAQAAAEEAQDDYNEAVTAAGETGTSGNLTAAKNNLAAATQKLAEAEKAYNDAMNSADKGVLKININLADVVTTTGTADKWQLLPNPVNGGIAYFYYTSILGAGETSAQLIDSVELDSSVTDDMFKRFDFDLNVALKSVQIAKDADGKITTDATTELDANATLVTPTSVDSVVNWTLK